MKSWAHPETEGRRRLPHSNPEPYHEQDALRGHFQTNKIENLGCISGVCSELLFCHSAELML
jgi:hypothetical protein